MKKCVFFDRDGVVNVDDEYVYKIEDFVYMEGFLEAFKSCKEKGYLLLMVTNQSGIGRGYYSLEDFLILSDFIQNDLKKKLGFSFDKIYFCAHKPSENCECRKPRSGMLLQAKGEWDIDLQNSYMIGDKESDVEAGINAGVGTTILFKKGVEAAESVESSEIYKDSKMNFGVEARLESSVDSSVENADSSPKSKANFVIDSLVKLKDIVK